MRVYNKLVRDRVPELIRARGASCEVQVLSDGEFVAKLEEKLQEELGEYTQSRSVEELVDIAEVMDALLRAKGVSAEAFEQLRSRKQQERGGFDARLLLVSVRE